MLVVSISRISSLLGWFVKDLYVLGALGMGMPARFAASRRCHVTWPDLVCLVALAMGKISNSGEFQKGPTPVHWKKNLDRSLDALDVNFTNSATQRARECNGSWSELFLGLSRKILSSKHPNTEQ